jgi:hypothetical protein
MHTNAARVAGLAATGMLLAACGMGGGGGTGAAASPSGGGSGGGGKAALTIRTPKDGASVTAPVRLSFTTSVALGPPSSGKDHVHVFIDGKTQDYTVVPKTTYTVRNIPTGRHTIGVTLQHADHSPAGPSAQVTVNVTGGGGASSAPSSPGGGGPYSY